MPAVSALGRLRQRDSHTSNQSVSESRTVLVTHHHRTYSGAPWLSGRLWGNLHLRLKVVSQHPHGETTMVWR